MNVIDRVIAELSPGWARRRAQDRLALKVLAHYDAATTGNRGASWRRSSADADNASANRMRLAFVGRDMIRNTPLALRAQTVICNNVVGDGIIWKVSGGTKTRSEKLRQAMRAHFDTTKIDADGRSNLYGLQRLVMNAVINDGEVLVRRRRRTNRDGLPLPFQLEVLEIDHLDSSRDRLFNAKTAEGEIREGIEYDAIGRRVAYWLFPQHPGASIGLRQSLTSRRVPASEVIHVYRQDRPKQMRGVSWFAPVALALQDLSDGQDAQIMRQKIAACFAAFRVAPEADYATTGADGSQTDVAGLSSIIPGRIQNLAPGEDIRFSTPPSVDGYDTFTRLILQTVASGMGITYEALSGDLSQVNFSSARMGRMEMDRNVSAWQWLLLIPQMMQPIAAWAVEAFDIASGQIKPSTDLIVDWVPPHRMLIDPSREIPAIAAEIRAGLASRQGKIRTLGYDPEVVLAEQIEDRALAEKHKLRFDSDVHFQAQASPIGTAPKSGSTTESEDDEAKDDEAQPSGDSAEDDDNGEE
jgi:lambda family phage portal protein